MIQVRGVRLAAPEPLYRVVLGALQRAWTEDCGGEMAPSDGFLEKQAIRVANAVHGSPDLSPDMLVRN